MQSEKAQDKVVRALWQNQVKKSEQVFFKQSSVDCIVHKFKSRCLPCNPGQFSWASRNFQAIVR